MNTTSTLRLASTRILFVLTIVSGVCLVTAQSASAISYSSVVLDDNPFAYWRLGETSGTTLHDASGNGHHADFAGSVTLGGPDAVYDNNTSANFNGGSVFFDSVDGLQDNFTVEFWTRPRYSNTHTIFAGENNAWGQWLLHRGPDDSVYAGMNVADRFAPTELGPNILVPQQWQHIVFAFGEVDAGSGVAEFYRNGELLHSKTMAKGAAWTGFTLSNALRGYLDEVAIYDYPLSAIQVAEHFEAAVPEPGSCLLAVAGALGLVFIRRRRSFGRGC